MASELACTRSTCTADLQYNRVVNLETSVQEAKTETVPLSQAVPAVKLLINTVDARYNDYLRPTAKELLHKHEMEKFTITGCMSSVPRQSSFGIHFTSRGKGPDDRRR
ncbi:hypothetical protein AVEN_31141-1 [Araneus ventricosus]|uniref:Uncharacterized protein n=1 Tax=Araneus ventricosus TaxID=182803 RepID=A0A4Y2IN62_ARAVE|nr:hypothetical protein AVEN_31141-1 [Araneus ventricosus]